MALTIDSPKSAIPERPDVAFVGGLQLGASVAVVDPIPRRVVYLAKVARVTPSGLVRLIHDSGHICSDSFRADGYAHVRRGWRNPWPRYIVNPEAPAAAAPEADHG